MNWKGIYAAMLTPLCPDGKVNTEEVRRLTEFLIEKGVHGLFPSAMWAARFICPWKKNAVSSKP